jgi:hypothetical protein
MRPDNQWEDQERSVRQRQVVGTVEDLINVKIVLTMISITTTQCRSCPDIKDRGKVKTEGTGRVVAMAITGGTRVTGKKGNRGDSMRNDQDQGDTDKRGRGMKGMQEDPREMRVTREGMIDPGARTKAGIERDIEAVVHGEKRRGKGREMIVGRAIVIESVIEEEISTRPKYISHIHSFRVTLYIRNLAFSQPCDGYLPFLQLYFF